MGQRMHYRRGVSLLFLLIATSASAEWTPRARLDYSGLEKEMSARSNGQLAGIWGSAAVYIGAALRKVRFRRNTHSSGVEYLVSRTGRKTSPLVVFFPGAFGDATSAGGLMVARQVRRSRNHVVILPNPWGENFQTSRPRFMPGDFESEARAMLEIVEAAIDFIGRERISGIHFIGESYGGFLAPATAHAMNRRGSYKVKSVMSISVPFQVGNAVDVIDRMSDQNEASYFDGGCRQVLVDFFRRIGFVFELIVHPNRNEFYAKECIACSDGIFAYQAFQQPLFELGKSLQARIPSPKWAANSESYWLRKMRFRDLSEVFYGISIDDIVTRDSANLAYWLTLIREEGTRPLALFALDDPLNPPPGVGRYEVIPPFRPDEALVLTRGGHLGFRGSSGYRKILRHQYRLSPASGASADQPDDALDNDPAAAGDGLDAEDETSPEEV